MTGEDSFKNLAKKNNWDAFFDAWERTKGKKDKISNLLIQDQKTATLSEDLDLVVYGSLARQECNEQSDVDWTLLIDGQASSSHFETALNLERIINQSNPKNEPGKTGMFGSMTFSHGLIHNIGGQEDTNHNLSKRIMLILESDFIEISEKSGNVYNRVLKGVIERYIDNDSGYSVPDSKPRVPRFLLNDIVRFWRTMSVDFATKQWDQEGVKWGIRNIKLRTSRKFLYVKGLLMCFDCMFRDLTTEDNAVNSHLVNLSKKSPAEVTNEVLSKFDLNDELKNLLSIYDEYLQFMADKGNYEALKDLTLVKMNHAKDPGVKVFNDAKKITNRFQEEIDKIFFHKDLKDFTKKYAIF